METINLTDNIFFHQTDINKQKTISLVQDTLHNAEDGDLFFEFVENETLSFDDGRLKSATYNQKSGFGFRGISGEVDIFARSDQLSTDSLIRASKLVKKIKSNYSGNTNISSKNLNNNYLYINKNPIEETNIKQKIDLLEKIDNYARKSNKLVRQVFANISLTWQAVQIVRSDGQNSADIRPLVRLNVSVVVEKNGRMETGSSGSGGRILFNDYLFKQNWQREVDEAIRIAIVNLESVNAPAGEVEIVLGPGWPGVMLHEAVGHGLEGDFNRKGTSIFSGRVGERVASKGVTVIDDGTLPNRRGSIAIDDEGTVSKRNILIEDGILCGFMQDRQNARLMGVSPTGNGRRQSYQHLPMPRMTNTFMENGRFEPQEIINSVKRGIYAVNFGGGQVDITSGKFVFSASEAYMLENGKIGAPVKGATLIGNGPDAMSKITMIGNDCKLDNGVGTCGKSGQTVPVGVGQPTLKIGGIIVGGTDIN